MAYLADDQNEKKKDAQEQDPNAPEVLSSPSAAAPSSSAQVNNTADAGAAAGKGSSSGSFTNLNKYINANVGNDASMGGAVQNNAQTKATAADQSGQAFQNTANQAIDSNTVKDNGVVDTLNSYAAGKTANRSADSYQAAAPNQDDFSKEYNATYGGPKAATDVEGYEPTLGSYDTVTNYGKLASGDSADRGALLSDVYGKDGNQYNGGERRLDSFILGSGTQGQKKLKDIADNYGNYTTNQFGKLQDLINQRATTAAATTDATRNAVQSAAQKAQSSLEDRLKQAATAANSANQQNDITYKNLVAGNADALKAAGVNDAGLAGLQSNKGIDLNALLNKGDAYTAGSFADQGDIGNYKNLLGLLNGAGKSASSILSDDQLAAGGSGAGFKDGLADAINQYGQLSPTLASALADKKSQENMAYTGVNQRLRFLGNQNANDLADLSGKLGVSAQDLQDAQKFGMRDISHYLNQGTVGMGDVGTSDQRAQYGKLLSMLGLNAPDMTQHAGPGYSFDKGGFLSALNAARAQAPQAAGAAGAAGNPSISSSTDGVFGSVLGAGVGGGVFGVPGAVAGSTYGTRAEDEASKADPSSWF